MIPTALSARYAKAIVDLAAQAGRLEAVSAGLRQLSDLVLQHPELSHVMRHPGFQIALRQGVFFTLISRLELDELLRPFIGLMIEKGRLAALESIAVAVEKLTDEHLGRVRAQATSAAPLSEAQCAAVRSSLERRVGRDVVLEMKVDPKLLAGLQVQLGSELMDGSVKGRLERLGRQLQSTH